MGKINRKRLLTLMSLISLFMALLTGAWYLKEGFKPFESQYIQQRNIEFVEAKYKKPYLIWRQEEIAECITAARKEPIDDWHNQDWLESLASDADIMNTRINFCEQGVSLILVPKNEMRFAYLKYNAINIFQFIFVAALISWLLGMLLVYWLPLYFSKFTRWLTTN